jgi:hypothetical protein
VAAVGWLYLIRGVGALALGPRVKGALPLQQLAGDDAQPLARMGLAWVPAGVAAALALSAGSALSPLARAVAIACACWIVLVLAGAVSDAAAISASVPSHVPDQLTRAGTWTAVALMFTGALLVRRR